MMRFRTVFTLVLLLLVCGTVAAQVEVFKRAYTIAPPLENVGWGEAVAGVDFDGDGKIEIYAVNNNMYDGTEEMIPRIYKYELDSTGWTIVWSATLAIEKQNTWPALTSGDWDKDGKMEIIWGPVNNYSSTVDQNPDRVIVFEEVGDGSDNMGVSDGAGGWRPNAQWTIESTDAYNLRPFRWVLHDIDADGKDELIFADRASSTAGVGYKVGVISVSTIPDNGDSSEVWTLEASGKGLATAANSVYDLAVIDSTAYAFHATTNGTVTRVRFRNGAYIVDSATVALQNVAIGGGFKNAQVVDINKDGTKEIIVAGYSSATNNRVYLVEITNGGDSLVGTLLYDPDVILGSGVRLVGSGYGDLDNDGNIDIVFGSRDGVPAGGILRIEYKGSGSITDPASYDFSLIDKGFGAGGERYDFVQVFNADADADAEVLYGTAYGSVEYDVPMVVLDRATLSSAPITIAAARVDANADFVPDSLGRTVTVVGVVTSNNQLGSSTQFYHFIQDATAGILAFKSGLTAPVVSYPVGHRIAVTGVIAQYNGLDEVVPVNVATDVIDLGPEYSPVAPKVVTIDQYLAGGEAYESQLIKIAGVAKTAGSAAWPNPGSSSNMTIWDGFASTTMRISNYTTVDDSAEVTYPVDVVGMAVQFDGSAPYSSGYQIIPRVYADFTQDVATKPNAKSITLLSPANGSTFTLNDSTQRLTFGWTPAVDLDGDALVYQWAPIGMTAKSTGNGGADTTYTLTANDLYYNYLGANDSLQLKWRVAAKDPANAAVFGVDTFSVLIVKGAIVGVPGLETLPTEFALAQNYPNPFNPSTTIRVALPMHSFVTLKIYNLLGEEVATLVNEERAAGYVNVEWSGRDQSGRQVASGVYLYRMVAKGTDGSSDFVSSKKMMLLK